MNITGTFVDEITHDIPANNWDRAQWADEFRVMRAAGIETVILIRAGVGSVRVRLAASTASPSMISPASRDWGLGPE